MHARVQDHRPLYDWVIERLAEAGLLQRPLPQQYEFARLNLLYTVMSKRMLLELVEGGHVDGWDDPRMPTLVGLRRRGYTPESIRLFAERIGVSKADQWIDMSVLEDCLRDDLNARAQRRIAVLDPVKLVIDNYPAGEEEECFLPNHPQQPELGTRAVPFRVSSGSSATISAKSRRRDTFVSRPARRCGCAMPSWSNGWASTRTRVAR